MKKLSTLIAIILIATIGGVYATWNYAGTSTNIGVQHNQTVILEDATQNDAAGMFTMTNNITSIAITPDSQTSKNAVLVATYSTTEKYPIFNLTFKPAINAGDDIEGNAITSYVYFGTERTFTWDKDGDGTEFAPVDLFVFPNGKSAPITIDTADKTTSAYFWEWNQSAGVFECEITFADITDIIKFNDPEDGYVVTLPSIDDYNLFKNQVLFGGHSLQLHMHISNIAPTV